MAGHRPSAEAVTDTSPLIWEDPPFRSKLIEALVGIVVVALVTRVVSEILAPLLPGLIALVVVGGLLVFLFRRR